MTSGAAVLWCIWADRGHLTSFYPSSFMMRWAMPGLPFGYVLPEIAWDLGEFCCRGGPACPPRADTWVCLYENDPRQWQAGKPAPR